MAVVQMKEPKPDKYGRQICPHCKGALELIGAWWYDGRLHTDKFSFRCCGWSYAASAEETERHQDGVIAYRKHQEVKEHLKSISK